MYWAAVTANNATSAPIPPVNSWTLLAKSGSRASNAASAPISIAFSILDGFQY